MSIIPINLCGDKILRKKTKKVHKIDEKTFEFITNMFETMHKANGIGLAANQVGRDEAILVVDVSEVDGYTDTKPMVVINPRIKKAEGTCEYEEGCLSFPGLRFSVKRPEKILLEYQDTDLKKKIEEFDGILARVLQHEIDHLNGILFIDYLSDDEKTAYEEMVEKIKRREIKTNYKITKPEII